MLIVICMATNKKKEKKEELTLVTVLRDSGHFCDVSRVDCRARSDCSRSYTLFSIYHISWFASFHRTVFFSNYSPAYSLEIDFDFKIHSRSWIFASSSLNDQKYIVASSIAIAAISVMNLVM
jgi:hypothetical protein